ncbi:ubiquitin-conjugating enzyme E2 T-like isoform X2 [Schistocerca americana]|uniref:ubiquitin-conjugating enzyme E2 T-like isoform X2 n=1 Tax=Schistocerca americana TaxID=7009 RepID=UPI001F4FB177|nr:ubiquitin-conjugating enzyme E2 T-like isoform X2 [Schistocerca americana]
MQKASRLKRELELMVKSPPSGIVGLEGTAYEAGVFKLEIQIPEKYPFEPPQVKFLTPIYHPNIDSGGRICLDLLKVGKWKATITLSYLLMSIRLLLAEPNPSDPLVAEIAEEFLFNRPLFDKTAREWTKRHACLNLEMPSENAEVSHSCGVRSEPTKRKSWQMEDLTQEPNASKCLKTD